MRLAGFAPSTIPAMRPYSAVPKIERTANRPMRKPKSPMRFVTNALRPANALGWSLYQNPMSR